MAKKKTKKKVAKKKTAARRVSQELVIRVQQAPVVPTTSDLSEPMRDGKKLTIPKTWMNDAQIIRMVQNTPKNHIYRRKGKGGQMFDYVTGSYVTKVLNFVFGWNWDFKIIQQGQEGGQVWVMGELTVRGTKEGETITKTQYGRADIKMKRDGKGMLDFGNDLKAAATDSLKKCASMLGIAGDIYGKGEYKEETGQEVHDSPTPSLPSPGTVSQAPKGEMPVIEEILCVGATKSGCGNEMTKSERDFSIKMYGKQLCRDCQKLSTPVKRK